MKRNHKICVCVVVAGAIINCGAYAVTPTAATCKTVFANNPSQCETYSIDETNKVSGGVFYLCTCARCSDGYHLASGSEYRSGNYDFFRTNTCEKDSATGGGTTGTERPKTCATGTLCTMCRGPQVSINGQLYCGLWADTKDVKTCTGGGSAGAYTMSPCCDSSGYAVGYATGCYVMGCKPGMVPTDARTSCVCDIGYYGTTTAGCTRCPPEGGIYGLTSEKGKTKITDCFFPKELGLTDSFGIYHYTENCDYKEVSIN